MTPAALALTLLLAATPAAVPPEMSLGRASAPVTVVEYASLGCPHCGVWSRDVFPAFQRQYIATGRVRFVLREMLNGDADLAAAGFMIARCAGRGRYFEVVEGLFAAQPRMQREGIDPPLFDVAAKAGLSRAQIGACLGDHQALMALEARADGYARDDKVGGTPTFDVAGRRLEGEASLDDLAKAIGAAEAARRQH
jgi:protein-disulfide isomerase